MDTMRIFSRQRRVSLRLITLAKPQAWRFVWMLGLLWVSVFEVRADTHYVSQGGQTPATPYTNGWESAASNIQDAINVAVAPDTVWVSNGVYNMGGTITPGSFLTNRVVVNAAITLRSFSNNPTNTIIEGAADPVGDANGLGSNAVRCVYLNNGASLIGFTLTNGHTMVYPGGSGYDRYGGGFLLYTTNGVVSNCVMVSNKVGDSGGGGCVDHGGQVNNCLFLGGYSGVYEGGAVIYYSGIVNNCVFAGNYSDAYTGGVGFGYGNTGACILNNCVISNNSSRYGPGGVQFYQGGEMNNCLVVGNWANYAHAFAGGPAGIDVGGPGTNAFTMNNCTVVNNSAKIRGGGVRLGYETNNTINNCIIYGNTCVGDSYSNIYIQAGCTATVNNTCSGPVWTGLGSGNIGLDPLLVNTNIGDYRLTKDSPCISTGTNQGWMTGAVDRDGRRRIDFFSGHVDMGCYEYLPNGTLYKIP